MSTTFITPATLAQAEWHLEASGSTDLVCPPRPPGRRGRIGMILNNTYLLLLAWLLCTMLGMETTLQKAHDVLTMNLTREDQWRLGVLRKAVTTRPSRDEPDSPDWYTKKLNKRGKRQKITWNGFEQVGYDDLVNAVRHFRDLFDYGAGTAPDLNPVERARRAKAVAAMKTALIAPTLISRPANGTAIALDATGQWAWSRGPDKMKHELEKKAEQQRKAQAEAKASNEDKDVDPPLEIADIATEDDDSDITAPAEPPPTPAELKRRCPDAAWGYRTEKDGRKGPGFGFHQHTVARVPHPDGPSDAEPHPGQRRRRRRNPPHDRPRARDPPVQDSHLRPALHQPQGKPVGDPARRTGRRAVPRHELQGSQSHLRPRGPHAASLAALPRRPDVQAARRT